LLRAGGKLLGSQEATDRYTEEWLANLERVPGKLTKLGWALGLLLRSVPVLRWQVRARVRRIKGARADIQKFGIRYDHFVVGAGSLRKELDDLINEDQPQSLAGISAKIRECVRVLRAQIDNDQLWLTIPFTISGYAAEDVRDELSAKCLRVTAAADRLIRESRILTYINDDPW
jgi:hypothetical protein